MKLILNDSTLEITSRNKENRYKKVANFSINSSNLWSADDNSKGYFIDAKAGDTIVVTPPKTGNQFRYLIAFTSTNTPIDGAAVSFANGTSERIRSSKEGTYTVSENCYLFILETNTGTDIWKPDSIVINGFTLDENGFL